jgi:hypothetical protein
VLDHSHRKTIDARPRRSVLESDHRDGSIFLSCALAVDLLLPRRAHLFCFSVLSLRAPYYQYSCQYQLTINRTRIVAIQIQSLTYCRFVNGVKSTSVMTASFSGQVCLILRPVRVSILRRVSKMACQGVGDSTLQNESQTRFTSFLSYRCKPQRKSRKPPAVRPGTRNGVATVGM